MTNDVTQPERCRVIGGDKLPAEIGGAAGICAAIERAAAADAPGADFSVEVRVLRPYMLAATVTMANGRVLPERKMAISDSKLRQSSVDRFAKTLAEEIAKAKA
jgi:hypothetical protein